MFASIAINVLTNTLKDTYTYHIPDEFADYVGIGSRVMVDFGVRKVLGYVVDVMEKTDYPGEVRDIVEVLDFSNELTLEQVEMAKKIASDTNCQLSKAMDAMYPAFLKSKFRRFISIKDFNNLDPHVAVLFRDKKKIILTSEILKKNPRIKKEIERGTLELDHDVFTYGRRKLLKTYSVNKNTFNVYESFTGLKKKLIDYLLVNEDASLDDIKDAVDCSTYLVNSLVKQEILVVEEKPLVVKGEKDKVSLRNRSFNFDQKQIREKFSNLSNKPFLFYSNDEKFNLELYLDICIDMILKDKKVLIVTPTLITNYTIYHYIRNNLMGFSILNFSSDMPNSDYYSNYLRLLNGDVEVVVTTKVGAFLPLADIGTIIVVDESNFNYINEMTPKYNTIEVLKFRAKYHNAKIILASNPLTVENYYRYFKAEYHMLKYIVPNQYQATLVSMYEEAVSDHSVISRALEAKLKATLNSNKQAMLILNARGYSNHLICRSCGHIAKCPKCNIPLTYYKEKEEIKCRYCGSKIDSLKCKCGEDSYSMLGIGLEMVSEKIREIFPNAKVLLIDSDTLRNYEDYQEIVVKIETKEVDIVIGTNNVISLNNYGDFNLVGLIAVDNLLNTSDYRASYNTFSLISNAIKNSDVVIQGYNLDHYAIKYGIQANFVDFYNDEIKVREAFKYPPYYEVNRLIITGDYKTMYHCANYFKKAYGVLMGDPNLCLGPTYVKIKKGVQLILKHQNYEKVVKLIGEVVNKFNDCIFNFERYPRSFN